jgi:hypothetical protein
LKQILACFSVKKFEKVSAYSAVMSGRNSPYVTNFFKNSQPCVLIGLQQETTLSFLVFISQELPHFYSSVASYPLKEHAITSWLT